MPEVTTPDRRPLWYALVGLSCLMVGVINFRNTYDDAFITYRYSFNLASGHGFVYNIGEHQLGTSAPLFGLLLGILSLPNPEWVPVIGSVLCVLSLAAASVGLYS